MNNTIVEITTSGQQYTLPGTAWTAAQIVNTYATSVPGIGAMKVAQSTNDNGDNVFVFRPETGGKGLK